jgi:deoxycytidine triphosphate deaminase
LPNLITGPRLRHAVEHNTFIEGGSLEGIEGVKYDFHMGSRILKSSYSQPIDVEKLPESDKGLLRIDPGEVVFVLTKETLRLPANMMAVLSPKRTLAHAGLMVMGGLVFDPNYSGVLWIGLHNFSSSAFPLRPGRKLIAALFYELDGDELQDFPPIAGETDFPDTLINLIKNYRPVELRGLQDEIISVKGQLVSLRTELLTDKDWKEDFKKSLEQHNNQLGQLIEGLKEEKTAREKEDDKIRTKLDSILSFAGAGRILVALGALILAAFLGWFVPKMLDRAATPSVTNLQVAPLPAPAPPGPPGKT